METRADTPTLHRNAQQREKKKFARPTHLMIASKGDQEKVVGVRYRWNTGEIETWFCGCLSEEVECRAASICAT